MKQLLQSLKTGETEVVDIPAPAASRGRVRIATIRSLVSIGTERMLVEFGKAGWLSKARQQPDKVRMVLEKVRTDGVLPTLEAVRSKLDQPIPLGYCNVGRVIDTGPDVSDFAPGERVVSNSSHAEIVSAPTHLCARIPDNVSDEEATFTVVGAIALQGIRLAQPTLGETVVVTGLGLIGLLTVQLLKAQGCRVFGIDFDPVKLALAERFGATTYRLSDNADPVAEAMRFSRGLGIDAVIVTATTSSSEPMSQAAQMCRKRGRIVLVGVTGLNLSRADFYEKELTFQVSCSYGPGRYDPLYEEKGLDYPVGFVRWTEQRNFEAVLDMLSEGRLDVAPLITHRFGFARVAEAYALMTTDAAALGIVLEYAEREKAAAQPARTVALGGAITRAGRARLAIIGGGNYASRTLVPALKDAGAELHTVVSSGGLSGTYTARKLGAANSSTDTDSVFADPDIDAIVIVTRHDSHAALVVRALDADKHVFVEKPIAIDRDGLAAIKDARERALARGFDPVITVGFNRRFAPLIQKMQAALATGTQPKAMVMTANVGAIPADSWVHDPEAGGGRVLGEGCHFIDLLRFFAAAPITRLSSSYADMPERDTGSIQLDFANGSIGTVHYFANGSKAFAKERLEIFSGGRILQLNNFRTLSGYGWSGIKGGRTLFQDKGQGGLARAFVAAIEGRGPQPIPFDEVREVALAALAASEGHSGPL